MKLKTLAAAFGAGCLFALPAYAFEIITDNSGFAAPVFFADDPDGDGGSTASGNPFITSLGPFEYHTPDSAFDDSYSFSGYSFEDEKLAVHADDAKADARPADKTAAPTKSDVTKTPSH